MDWTKTNWNIEDEKYYKKRKVSNSWSWRVPHMMGEFYSFKMNKSVEYESLGEMFFYLLLELDGNVKRYYVQPVEIQVPYFSTKGLKKYWTHIPDVLVFRQGSKPLLIQIKGSMDETPKMRIINRSCVNYAAQNNYTYQVVYPKTLPGEILYNIKFLTGFLKKRKYFDELTSEVIFWLANIKQSTIIGLAQGFATKANPLVVLPIIYHLIAIGTFTINLTEKINQYSIVRVNNESEDYMHDFFGLEVF